jgi:hypothetical protein
MLHAKLLLPMLFFPRNDWRVARSLAFSLSEFWSLSLRASFSRRRVRTSALRFSLRALSSAFPIGPMDVRGMSVISLPISSAGSAPISSLECPSKSRQTDGLTGPPLREQICWFGLVGVVVGVGRCMIEVEERVEERAVHTGVWGLGLRAEKLHIGRLSPPFTASRGLKNYPQVLFGP